MKLIINIIIQCIAAIICLAYLTTAFLFTFSEGKESQPTIFNLIGILMFIIAYAAYKILPKHLFSLTN